MINELKQQTLESGAALHIPFVFFLNHLTFKALTGRNLLRSHFEIFEKGFHVLHFNRDT